MINRCKNANTQVKIMGMYTLRAMAAVVYITIELRRGVGPRGSLHLNLGFILSEFEEGQNTPIRTREAC